MSVFFAFLSVSVQVWSHASCVQNTVMVCVQSGGADGVRRCEIAFLRLCSPWPCPVEGPGGTQKTTALGENGTLKRTGL